MQRILLLLESTKNRQFLIQLLAQEYEVLLYEDEGSLRQDFDLCIAEGWALKKNQSQIQQLRAEAEPVFLPYVLLTTQRKVTLLRDDLQNTVDEVIITPIEKMELLVRVKSLLRSRRLSLELEAKNQKLIQLTILKNRFISIAAHDLRNPLNVISGSTQMLESYRDKLSSEKQQELFIRIKRSVDNMNQLLEDTLTITKAEEGKLQLNLSLVNLENFCRDLISEFELIFPERQIDFVDASEETKPVPMDEKFLRHILGNLLSNALKYSTQESIVEFELNCQNKKVTFIIQDTGIGIPQEKLSNLFEPFNRANNVGAISGSGLGLSIVKQCVDLHGGTIDTKSEVGVGTTFTVQLPIIQMRQ